MPHSTSAQAIPEIVIVKTDRSNESVPSSVKLLACSYNSRVTVGRKTADGHQRDVRHGHLPEREVMTGIGPVAVRQPHGHMARREPKGISMPLKNTQEAIDSQSARRRGEQHAIGDASRQGWVHHQAISPLGDAQCITLGGHALAGDHDVSGARVRFME